MEILAALFLDALLGDPKHVPHPVAGIGTIVLFWEKRLYPGADKRRQGLLFCAAVLTTTLAVVAGILSCASFLGSFIPGLYEIAVLYLLYSALAWRSLKDHSLPVALALFRGELAAAREKLSHIVGRDTQSLDEAGILRAVIETIGENFIDGVFSVLFFMALGYAWGEAAGAVFAAWFFKGASTLDSMVGYDDERYRDFGRAGARLDDVLNFVPARLGGLVVLAAGGCLGYPFSRGLRVFLRDRKKHKSPNSAHGESAFAGLLGVRLGGGAVYGGVFEERPVIGDPGSRDVEPFDILRAHSVLDASVAFSALILYFIAVAS
ncbi:MAG: adenosylcobinamide-phosphate synthase CbiB [Synergistaceae bacterium]|jgi:adenosylcobinamide-phosphate synthase|nr:adenosylcobinamide-phosphate synthase CbiB [Synergistaceae bacterium]